MTRRATFQRIFDHNLWRESETRSGGGSTMMATEGLREELPKLLRGLGITSLLDAGCGDVNWMPDLGDIDYIGVDIVPGLVEEARDRRPDLRFASADIVSGTLPRTDAILCRDVLQHLTRGEVAAAIENFKRSGADWLIATTFRPGNNEGEGKLGGYQEWNLETEPFGLGQTETGFDYIGWYRIKGKLIPVAEAHLGVWRMVG